MKSRKLLPLVAVLIIASLLDSRTLADNSTPAISNAFSVTFLSVAGLCFLTFLFAAWGRRRDVEKVGC